MRSDRSDGAPETWCSVAEPIASSHGIVVARRSIVACDEDALLPSEKAFLRSTTPERRRASAAARVAARDAITRLGEPPGPILRATNGAPVFPPRLVGSLAHDDQLAVAAVARAADLLTIGVDVEPDEPLPDDMRDLVLTPAESRANAHLSRTWPAWSRAVFAAKEAVYKALNPADGVFLEFGDIEVDLEGRSAMVGRKRALDLSIDRAGRLVVVAFVSSGTRGPPTHG